MLKRPVLWFSAALFLAALSATGTQRPVAQTTAKASAQTAVADDVARAAAENRVCDGLKVVQAKLGQLERSVASATRLHGDFKAVVGRIKAEKLTPRFEKRTIGSAKTAQVRTDLAPIEMTRTVVRITGQVRGIKDDVLRVRGALIAQLADLQKSWDLFEQDMKRAAGLRKVGGAASGRPCVVEEAKRAQGQMAALGAQASNLQSEIDDLRDMLGQEYEGPCGDPRTCPSVDCIGCCAWKCPITAAEGSPERHDQEALRAECELACARAVTTCAFKNFDQNADQLFGIMSTVIKDMKEKQQGIIRNLI